MQKFGIIYYDMGVYYFLKQKSIYKLLRLVNGFNIIENRVYYIHFCLPILTNFKSKSN